MTTCPCRYCQRDRGPRCDRCGKIADDETDVELFEGYCRACYDTIRRRQAQRGI